MSSASTTSATMAPSSSRRPTASWVGAVSYWPLSGCCCVRLTKARRRFIVLRGKGGEGKTALACELARWLVASRRFQRAAFASLEHTVGARSLLQTVGEQLVPGFAAEVGALGERVWQLVARALCDQPTLLVIDNVGSVLPPYGWAADAAEEEPAEFDPDLMSEVLDLCGKLVETGSTALVFTSRSPLPAPFDDAGRALEVGRLPQTESLELLSKVLGEGGHIPATRCDLESREKIEELIAELGGHARSLMLIARELREGHTLGETAEGVRQFMVRLEHEHPGKRERSLFASLELSLRKLPTELRSKLPPLAVFHGGGHVVSIGKVLGLEIQEGEDAALAQSAHRRRPGRATRLRLPPIQPSTAPVHAPRAGRLGARRRRDPLGRGDG